MWGQFCTLTPLPLSLTIKILHLGQGSFTRKVRTIFTLKIIVSIFVKLFLILVLQLRQFFIVRIFVKRATGLYRILVYTGFGLDRFHCISLCIMPFTFLYDSS